MISVQRLREILAQLPGEARCHVSEDSCLVIREPAEQDGDHWLWALKARDCDEEDEQAHAPPPLPNIDIEIEDWSPEAKAACIAQLERVLERARSGRLVSFFAVPNDGDTYQGFSIDIAFHREKKESGHGNG